MQAYRFEVTAGTPAADDGPRHRRRWAPSSDAFSVPFTAMDRATTESVIESGRAAGGASVPLSLRGGSLQVTLANSVVPQFVVPSQYANGRRTVAVCG